VKRTTYEALNYAIFLTYRPFLLLRSKYSPQHPVLNQSQSVYFP